MTPVKRRKRLRYTRHAVRSLLELNPSPWRWSVGIEAGVAMLLPMGLFTLLGNQTFGLIAALGGFTALYCAKLQRNDRIRVLPILALGFVVCSTLGVLCSGNEWLTIACQIFVTALSCLLSVGFGIGSPGPLMFVLVTALSGRMANTVNLQHTYLQEYTIPILVALGSILAILVVLAPLAIPSFRNRLGAASGLRQLYPKLKLDKQNRTVIIRVIIAVTLASFLSKPLGAHRAYWVVISTIAILQSGHNRRLTNIKALHRVLGTLLGVLIFEVIMLVKPSGWLLVLIITVLQFATEVVVGRNYGLALLFITPLALTNSTAGATGNIQITVQGRMSDMLFGAIIAMAVFWIGEWLAQRKAYL